MTLPNSSFQVLKMEKKPVRSKSHLPFFILTTIIGLLFFLKIKHPSVSQADGPTGNLVGVNLAGEYDENKIRQAIEAVGPGGNLTVIATAADREKLQKVFDVNNSFGNQRAQVYVREETWGRPATQADAQSFTAMLGGVDTHGQKVYVIPWNEPNHLDWWGFSNTDEAARATANYLQAHYNALVDSGLYGNKVLFLTPMVDQFHGNGAEFYQKMRDYGLDMSIFHGAAMNLYIRIDPATGRPFTDPLNSGLGYREILKQFGFSDWATIDVLAAEMGAIIGYGNPIYPNEYPAWLSFYSFLNFVVSHWQNDPNFLGFTPLSASDFGNNYLLSPEFRAILQQFITPGAVGTFDMETLRAIFEAWLESQGLIECKDEKGNVFGYARNEEECQNLLSQLQIKRTPLACNVSNPGGPDSRPVPCDACNKTDKMIGSCATSFSVNDTVSYERGDSDFMCEDQHWVERDWGGLVTVDPSQTTIPFVGKKGQENRLNYLADYFEGICPYYTGQPCADEDAPPWQVLAGLTDTGVWQRLAPPVEQDRYKREMVSRARRSLAGTIEEGAIHDYLVSYKGESAKLSEFAGHLPPETDDPNYLERYEAWKNSGGGKWYRLWAAVPMFSREDTPGQIAPYLGSKQKDRFEILNPEAQVEKVPHVARLYETVKAVNEMLLPMIKETLTSPGAKREENYLLASAQPVSPQVLGEKVYLAQGDNCDRPFDVSIVNVSYDGKAIYYSVHLSLNPPGNEGLQCHLYVNNKFWGGCIAPSGTTLQAGASAGLVDPVPAPGDGAYYISASAQLDRHTFCGFTRVMDTACQVTIAAGRVTQTTCGVSVPSVPTCGLPKAMPVEACEKEAITDSNPNDNLCCDPIQSKLDAIDQFYNKKYLSCDDPSGEYDCRVNSLGVEVCKHHCHDKVTENVERKFGVALSHPYLREIWEETAEFTQGVFNIFRPPTEPKFEELDAASDISYGYTPGTVSPSSGRFYFPYLGGVQKAKEWVIQALSPPQ